MAIAIHNDRHGRFLTDLLPLSALRATHYEFVGTE
jgi:hypothetical protein